MSDGNETRTHAIRHFKYEVAGKDVTGTLDTRELEVDKNDLMGEAARVAARMGFVSNLMRIWKKRHDRADAEYRTFRETTKLATGNKKNAATGKPMSEWMCKAAVEAHPDFLKHKDTISDFESDYDWLERFYFTLQTKSRMIESMMRRDNIEHGNAHRIGRGSGAEAERKKPSGKGRGRVRRPSKTTSDN